MSVKYLVISELLLAVVAKLAFSQPLIHLLFESMLQRNNLSLLDIRNVLPDVLAHPFVDL